MANLFTLDRICRSTPVLELNDYASWPAWRSNLELYLTAHNIWRVVADRGIRPQEPLKHEYFRHAKIITAAGASLVGVTRSASSMEIFDEDRYVADCKPFDEWKARDAQARLIILASVSVELAVELSKEPSSAGMWDLVNRFFAAGLSAGGAVRAAPAAGPAGPGSNGAGDRGHRRSGGSRGRAGNGARSASNVGNGGNQAGGNGAIGSTGSGGNGGNV